MRFVLFGLSVLAMLLASRRFYLSEPIGYDVGALFLLLVGIQLLVTAAIFHEHHETRARKPAASAKDHKDATDSPSAK